MNKKTLILCECGIIVAMALIFDLLSKAISGFFPNPWIAGGGITIGMVPLVFISYRHGNRWGILTGLMYSVLQMLTGWFAPPAGTVLSFIMCVLLDYVLAFAVLGTAAFFASKLKNNMHGYAFGAFVVCMLRFLCSFLSGAILWGESISWGMTNVWLYSFVYNISYMLPNAILTAVIIVAICKAIDPKILKPIQNNKKGI